MKSTNDKIDEILNKYAEYYYDSIEGFGSMHTITKDEAIRQIQKLIKETLQECIGEEEEDDLNPFGMMARSTGRNTLRQEALTKLEELLKENK